MNQLRVELSRRGMMLGTVACASQALQATIADDKPEARSKNMRIGIIGAGLSGMCCGYELAKAGYRVEVFEARNRLGGRVHSVPEFAPGQTVEFGGEFIGGNHPLWIYYAKEFGLKLLEIGDEDRESEIILQGQRFSGRALKELQAKIDIGHAELCDDAKSVDWEQPWAVPNSERLDKTSLAERIATMKTSEWAKRAISTEFLLDMACEPRKMSYLALACIIKAHGVEKYWTETEMYRCEGGNQRLASRFAEHLTGAGLHLDCPVMGIEQKDQCVQIQVSDGRCFEFDDVVLAIPPSVWQKITITPGLPPALHPQMGAAGKFIAAVDQRFWHPERTCELMTDSLVGITWEDDDTEDDAAGVLVSFTGGTLAEQIHDLPFREQSVMVSADMERNLPGFSDHVVKSEVVDWLRDPWMKGGYSFPAPGAFLKQARLLHDGIGRLHFAGEHTSLGFAGFMEGGLHAGRSIATKLRRRDGLL